MKLLRIALVLLLLLLGLPFVIGSFMSSEWDVEASVVIPAPRAFIHYVVEDPTRWPQWNTISPRAEHAVRSGAERGVGAILIGGSGDVKTRWEITASDPEQGMTFTRSLGETLQGTGEITYQAVEGGTEVTWHDHGDVGGSPIAKLFAPMVRTRLQENCDRSMLTLETLVLQVQKEEVEKAKAEKQEGTPPADGE